MPFEPGQSGNPAGRPIGARNRKTLLMEAMLEGDGEDLTRRLIQKALAGDPTAMRLCIERLLPRMRDRPVAFPLPQITGPADAARAASEIQAAVGVGALSPREGMDLLRLVDKLAETVAKAETEPRTETDDEGDAPPDRLVVRWADGTLVADAVRQPDGTYRSVASDLPKLNRGDGDDWVDRQ
jgi:hypothetical protein